MPCGLALLALGGYGRCEMSPHSDVDIMFLYPAKVKSPLLGEFQKSVADRVLYLLWDLNLQVGHCTRSVADCLEEAQKNIQSKNAMLEARLITGDSGLFASFTEAFRRFCRKASAAEYIQERLADQEARRERYGGTVFLQEPDIKNGVGGLRDYHNIRWMVRLKLDNDQIDRVLLEKYLSRLEHRDFTLAYDFLVRVRNELHFQSPRPSDLLDLERQPQVALKLGYRQKDIFRRVESFMRDYYQRAQCIYLTSKYLEKRLALDAETRVSFRAVIDSRRYGSREALDGFVCNRGVLSSERTTVFTEDPERLVRVFRHAQQLRATLDVELCRQIMQSLPLINAKVIQSPTANRSFRAILQSVGEVYPTLQQMLELGVLARFVPEFSGLVCLVQHEYYHRYTADVHTLNTIRELDKVFNGEDPPLTAKYSRELHQTEQPALLYLILLLHDIGKGRGMEGHAERGAEMVAGVLRRMQVKPDLHAKIAFIIRHHLDMARFWQHFDVDDPRTAQSFAQLVETAENLRYLYVHNFCDARGTAGGLWNSYKDMLHLELFRNTLTQLGESPALPPEKTMTPRETIQARLPDLSPEEIEAHYSMLPERYFVYTSEEEIALHLRMVNQLLRRVSVASSMGSLVPVIEWHDDLSLSMTVVHIVTWDRAGLFFKLAGAFSVAGLSIVSSKALTRADHITIDTFYVVEPSGGVVQSQKAREVFSQALEAALIHSRDLLPEIVTQAKRHAKPDYLRTQEILRAPIPPSVDVYHELSLKRTIIEIQANDQIGLLYRLARAIHDHGFDITFARISTERHVAVDTFYIEPVPSATGDPAANLMALRESLNRIVMPATGVAVG